MRDRLIELFKQADEKAGEYIRENDHMDFIPTKDELAGVYADHLLANGVIVPPCKVGDDVYSIVPTYSKCHFGTSWNEIRCQGCEDECDSHGVYAIRQERVIGIAFDGSWKAMTNKSGGNYKRIGESIYGLLLTHEEAEKALAGRSNE